MKFYNLKENDEQVSFAGAVKQGLGRNQGLFFPESIPSFDNIEELLALPLVERSVKVSSLIACEIGRASCRERV